MAIIHAENTTLGAGFLDQIDQGAKTALWSGAIQAVSGEPPIVTEQDGYTNIDFTPGQIKFFRAKLDNWAAGDPGEVRINYKPVLAPWAIKKYWPWAAGAVALGWFLGKAI